MLCTSGVLAAGLKSSTALLATRVRLGNTTSASPNQERTHGCTTATPRAYTAKHKMDLYKSRTTRIHQIVIECSKSGQKMPKEWWPRSNVKLIPVSMLQRISTLPTQRGSISRHDKRVGNQQNLFHNLLPGENLEMQKFVGDFLRCAPLAIKNRPPQQNHKATSCPSAVE